MKKIIIFTLLLLAVTFTAMTSAPQADELKPIGTLKIIQGKVAVFTREYLDWVYAENGQPLYQGELVKTDFDSVALIIFSKTTKVKIPPDTIYEIYPDKEPEYNE